MEKASEEARIRRANAAALASGYTMKKRCAEIVYLSLFIYLWCLHFITVGRFYILSPRSASSSESNSLSHYLFLFSNTMLSLLIAAACADLLSGILHWLLDSYGSPRTLIFGSFIRSFREHHVDQTAMCKHDFIETNADTAVPLLPVMFLQYYFLFLHNNTGSLPSYGNLSYANIHRHVFILTLCLLILMTNEIHKWSHQVRQAPLVRYLMQYHILLSPKGHRKHHKDPFDCSYCITTGWLNPFLDFIQFWRGLEKVVYYTTGAVARANDQELLGK